MHSSGQFEVEDTNASLVLSDDTKTMRRLHNEVMSMIFDYMVILIIPTFYAQDNRVSHEQDLGTDGKLRNVTVR